MMAYSTVSKTLRKSFFPLVSYSTLCSLPLPSAVKPVIRYLTISRNSSTTPALSTEVNRIATIVDLNPLIPMVGYDDPWGEVHVLLERHPIVLVD
jgi:hypothetical protein